MNAPEIQSIIRHGEPSNEFDQLPYGTICNIVGSLDIYIQKSKDEKHPNWVLIPAAKETNP